MRQSNLYIILYSAALTILCGGLLAFASESLKDKQAANVALEKKKNILATVLELSDTSDIEAIYRAKVKEVVINSEGNAVSGIKAEDIVIAAEYKKPVSERLLPVYEFLNEKDSSKVDAVVLPVYGYGLWNNIWGFVALEADFKTIKGVIFDHVGETPGLGARIVSEEIQERYKGKKIFEQSELVSVIMMKGEGKDYSSDAHKVDGMSGATLTGKGVNNMLKEYFGAYLNYLKKHN